MKISLIYDKSSTQIKTIYDHVNSFKKYSKHDINIIDQNDFDSIYKIKSDVVVLHYSIMHMIPWYLSRFINIIKFKEGIPKEVFKNLINDEKHWTNKEIKTSYFYHLTNFLINYKGNKFAFIQDEYYDTNLIKMFLEIININTVFTCIPKEHISRIYDNLNTTGFVHNLTGYVPDYNFERIPIKNRNCDVFYRGRVLHYKYGDLGQDKMNIGKYMDKYCKKYNLVSNIDWNAENCIYGDEWFKVLGASKVTLATESGSTIFDLDKSIQTEIDILLDEKPLQGSYTKSPKYSYEEICNKVNLKKNEVLTMGQISPKMFEAIMLGTVLVMYEGFYYPGFLIPDVHYIVLKKDYSNIKDVINKIKDDDFLQNMANKAYNDIIKSGLYSYKKFIEMFDKEVESPYIYKPNYLGNKNLKWYQQTKYMNKKIIMDNINKLNNLSTKYDSVIMLTWSNWETEPRSNRYHYATRFSKELPVYFVQPTRIGFDKACYMEILNIYPNINLIKYSTSKLYRYKNITYFKKLMKKNNIKNPLIWSYSCYYDEIINLYPNSYKIFHATENYFCNNSFILVSDEVKQKIKKRINICNLIVSVSDEVNNTYIKKLNLDKNKTFVLENGCDAEFYINLRKKINLNETKEKIVIYQGGINSRIDFNLLKNLIQKLPDWTFWFCGIEDNTIKDWQEIKQYDQVKYFGELKIEQFGKLMIKSTVGIIPYIKGDIIYTSFPLKSFEYISCGLPVVTVPIKSLEDKNKDNIFQITTNADGFAKEIERSYTTRYDKNLLELREQISLANSYNNRFKQLKNKILSHLSII